MAGNDNIGEWSAKRVAGRIVEAVRVIRFQGVTGSTAEAALDSILSSGSIPADGEEIELDGQILVLEELDVRPVDKTVADIELTYRRQEIGEIIYSGGTALRQITTQLDRNGVQIIVAHQGDQQGGEINVDVPQATLSATLIEETNTPGAVSREWVGFANDGQWNGGAARTWLCTSVTFELANNATDPKRYRMTYEFVHDPDKHDPQVVYIDPETGRPPPGLVIDVGYKTVQYHGEKNFSVKFP